MAALILGTWPSGFVPEWIYLIWWLSCVETVSDFWIGQLVYCSSNHTPSIEWGDIHSSGKAQHITMRTAAYGAMWATALYPDHVATRLLEATHVISSSHDSYQWFTFPVSRCDLQFIDLCSLKLRSHSKGTCEALCLWHILAILKNFNNLTDKNRASL